MEHITLTKNEFEARYCRPCVYILFRESKALYVGFSRIGLIRVLRVNNHGRDRNYRGKAFDEYDRMEVTCYDTEQEASHNEKLMISTLHPKYNILKSLVVL